MPSHPVALALIELSGVPIAAPSANKSGKPSPTTADHVLSDLGDTIPGVVDGGPCEVGLESTVVDCTDADPSVVTILRPGGISREQLQSVIATVHIDPSLESGVLQAAPKAPGMKYTHYAPSAPVRLVRGSPEFFVEVVKKLQSQQQKVGVLCSTELAPALACADHTETCGSRANLQSVAQGLFAALRRFDSTDVTIILAEPFDTFAIGHAIMNRLSKSAGHLQISSLDDL
jgi:L-threonylcarbamoyladenylate synthase